jgi:tetratricopeptide (TPR) repeat protein
LLTLLLLFLAADSPIQLLQRGLLALEQGDLTQARAAFEEVTKEQPRNAYAWVSLAETYSRLKQPAAAGAAAAKAEKFGGDNPAIDHALAMYFTKTGEFRHAAELEQKFAASGRADAEAQERTAGLFLNAGKAPEALAAAEKAVEQHPSPGAENVLGRALIATGRAGEGERHLAIAWDGSKTDSHLAFDYCQALLRRQDFAQAADVLATALESHPDDPQLVLALGVARYGQRRFDEAIGAFLKVIRIDPQVEQPYVFLGKLLDQAGEHLAEITMVSEKWAAQNPRNAEGPLLLAKARLAGDAKDPTAEALLRKSISLDGQNWEAHYELGVLLEGKRNWPGAAEELKRSADLDEKQAMPHYHLARVYDRLGEAEKAKAERALHERLTGH